MGENEEALSSRLGLVLLSRPAPAIYIIEYGHEIMPIAKVYGIRISRTDIVRTQLETQG